MLSIHNAAVATETKKSPFFVVPVATMEAVQTTPMHRHITTAVLYTVATTVLFGIVYPLVVTGAAQLLFRDKANGQLIQQNGQLIGSRIIGQAFTGPAYFHSRPSAAGN